MSVLPIDPEKLEEMSKVNEVAEAPTPKVTVEVNEVEEVEVKEPEPKIKQEEVFEVEKEKPKRKKRVLSDTQKEKLKIAREKSLERRRALAEAKKIQKAEVTMAKKKKLQEKMDKKLEEDAMIELKAKMYHDAKASAGWSEEKLIGLMTKTIDSYIERKKAAKPVPKVHIPAKTAFPQYSPQAQQHYVNQAPQQQNYYPQHHPAPNQYKAASNDPYQTLFGFGT